MRRTIVFILLFALYGGFLMGTTLTIMTYNIRHGLGVDNIFDFSRVIETIKEVDPDILILNEVDQGNPRSGEMNQADIILSKFPIKKKFGFVLPRPEWMLAVNRGCAVIITEVEGKEIVVMGKGNSGSLL